MSLLFVIAPFVVSQQALRHHNTFRAPESSIEQPGDVGVRAHSNVLIMYSPSDLAELGHGSGTPAAGAPPYPGLFYETPASLACIYELVDEPPASDCNPNVVTRNPSGGAGSIAIVDAYDDPTAASDLNTFSEQFGLAPANLSVVYAGGSEPAEDPTGGWELEESLDIEYAHAMAPGAKIYLVEANSNNYNDLFAAVYVANNLLKTDGGELSMSWGGSEFSEETLYDAYYFTIAKVMYFAAAGDAPGVEYPSASPYVVAAGGSSTDRDPFTGRFESETAWQTAGGGPSAYESLPAYQRAIAPYIQRFAGYTARSTPDLAFDSDPNTGVWVYSGSPSLNLGWWILGGTSVSSPSLAGIVNAAHAADGTGAPNSGAGELTKIYDELMSPFFRNITYGNCGPFDGFQSTHGWTFCTGIGSPLGLKGK